MPELIEIAFDGGEETRRGALRALGDCIAAASPDELLELDELCRRNWWYERDMGWRTVRPGDVIALADKSADPARTLGVLSFHPDGRVRERAVRQLAEATAGAELSFLLIRLNDWVGVVATAAERAVARRITPAYADAFVDNLPILLRLGARRRRPHDALIAAAIDLLLGADSSSALERGLGSSDRRVRRTLFRACLETSDLDRAALIERALSDEDSVIRVAAARRARQDLSPADLERLAPRLLRDPYPAVRSEGLAAAVEGGAPNADSLLFAALTDRSRTVRETARFCLRRHRNIEDFASIYRVRIAELRNGGNRVRGLAAALLGLGESGRSADASVLVPFLADPRPTVRAAAARAVAMLDIESTLPRLVGMLSDASPVVTRQVRRAIEPRIGSVSLDDLRHQIAKSPHVSGRLDGLLLGRRLRKWDAIVLLLENVRDRYPEVSDAAVAGVRRWIVNRNASFEQPTREQLRALRSVLELRGPALDQWILNELDAIVCYWETSLPTVAETSRPR
ncbi:MAG TPA: HEAT repeat domain-containing protein [Gemmatimonadaceae bacterium]|nr:HEAT repeat domain-containing protein [Gemmatimonadaceae bacterium]